MRSWVIKSSDGFFARQSMYGAKISAPPEKASSSSVGGRPSSTWMPRSAGAVGVPLDQRALDVVEAAHGVEVVLLVVIERRLVPQPLPHRIRIGVDRGVVGVVIEVAVAGYGHAPRTVSNIDVAVKSCGCRE